MSSVNSSFITFKLETNEKNSKPVWSCKSAQHCLPLCPIKQSTLCYSRSKTANTQISDVNKFEKHNVHHFTFIRMQSLVLRHTKFYKCSIYLPFF